MKRSRGRHRRRPGWRNRWALLIPAVAGGVVAGLVMFGMASAAPEPPPSGDPVAAPATPFRPEGVDPVAPVAPSTTTTTTAATPVESVPSRRGFTMAFTGDVLIHAGVRNAAARHGEPEGREYDFRPLLEPIRPIVANVDWAVCHLEVTLAADNTGLTGFPRFRAPREVAADLADLGYDACSTASNHSLDYGTEGIAETIEVMEDAGLRFTGTARSAGEEQESRLFSIGGATVAHLSYSYGFNGLEVPADRPWSVRAIDEAAILADAETARRRGAEFVVVSLHWGSEYQHEPNAQQRELAPRLIGSPDIDLLIGHHAHVVQPIERIDGEWVVYGVGNLLSNQIGLPRRDELLVVAVVDELPGGGFGVTELTAVPLFLDTETMTVHPSGPALRTEGLDDGLAGRLDDSHQRVLDVLGDPAAAGYDVMG